MIVYVIFFLYALQNVGDGMLRKSPHQKKDKCSLMFMTVREFSAGGDLGQALIELIRISLSFTLQDKAGTILLIAKRNHYVISLPVINNRFLFTCFSCSHSFIFNCLTFVHGCSLFLLSLLDRHSSRCGWSTNHQGEPMRTKLFESSWTLSSQSKYLDSKLREEEFAS